MKPTGLVSRMQASPDVVERSRQRVRLLVGVPELDRARTHQRQPLVALPVDAGVADGAAGVVVGGEWVGVEWVAADYVLELLAQQGELRFSQIVPALLQPFMLRETNVKDICVDLAKAGQIENVWGGGNRKPHDEDVIRLSKES